jgi:hypothetical protein
VYNFIQKEKKRKEAERSGKERQGAKEHYDLNDLNDLNDRNNRNNPKELQERATVSVFLPTSWTPCRKPPQCC